MRALLFCAVLVAIALAAKPSAFITPLASEVGFSSEFWSIADNTHFTKLSRKGGYLLSAHSLYAKDGWLYGGEMNCLSRWKYEAQDFDNSKETVFCIEDPDCFRVESVSFNNNTMWIRWETGMVSHIEARSVSDNYEVMFDFPIEDPDAQGHTPGVGITETHWAFASKKTRMAHLCAKGATEGHECPQLKIVGIPAITDETPFGIKDISFETETGLSPLLYYVQGDDFEIHYGMGLGKIDLDTATWKAETQWDLPWIENGTVPESVGLGYVARTKTVWVADEYTGVYKAVVGKPVEAIADGPKWDGSWPCALCVCN